MRVQRVKRNNGKEVYKKSNDTLKEILWFSACMLVFVAIILIPYVYE